MAGLDGAAAYRALRFDDGERLGGRVAVLSSAFNPPTNAHLAMLAAAAGVPGVAGVAAMLTTRNVAKGLYGAPLEHRVGMLLAEAGPAGFAVLSTNAARFVDQAVALTELAPGVEFDFITGYDTLVRLFDARYYAEGAMERELAAFFARHGVIALNRDDATPADVERYLHEPAVRPFATRIMVVELAREHAVVSSTGARDAVVNGDDAPVPALAAAYIARNGLYKARETPTAVDGR